MNRKRSALCIAAMSAVTLFSARTAHAQGEFAGTWTIAEWKVAPWIPGTKRSSIGPNNDILRQTLVISSKGLSGPKLLSCPNAKFVMVNSPYEGLFEGGLTVPKADGPALGFKVPVKTLRPNCDFDFHMREENAVMFALDNVLYTMIRKTPVPK